MATHWQLFSVVYPVPTADDHRVQVNRKRDHRAEINESTQRDNSHRELTQVLSDTQLQAEVTEPIAKLIAECRFLDVGTC